MRPAIILTLVLFGLLGHAHAKDWNAIGTKFEDMVGSLRNALETVLKIAKDDNKDVGEAIAAKVEKHQAKCKEALRGVTKGIAEKTLTEEQAREVLKKMKDAMPTVHADVEEDLKKLSEAANAKIKDTCSKETETLKAMAEEFLALLK